MCSARTFSPQHPCYYTASPEQLVDWARALSSGGRPGAPERA